MRGFLFSNYFKSDKQTDIRFAGEFKEGRGTTILDTINKIRWVEIKQINCHLTGNHFHFRFVTEVTQVVQTGDALGFHFLLHHHGHDALHTRNSDTQYRESLVHTHGHRHARIAQGTNTDINFFLQ